MDIALIGCGESDGQVLLPDRIGSKAANLQRLARIGLRAPAAFVLDTDICTAVLATGRLTDEVRACVRSAMARLESVTRRRFGGSPPLLVSVRSSPPISMPGMLDTLLNVGLTDATTRALLRTTGNPALVWDSARRFAEVFAETVYGCPATQFAPLDERVLKAERVKSFGELDPLTLRDLARGARQLAESLTGTPIPDDPYAQLDAAIEAVFRSWASPHATTYRRLAHLDDRPGTAVIVQAMVFGNGGGASGSGVGFTRNPSTGADELYVDFLFNAQGEDVVSGRRHLAETTTLSTALPDVHDELQRARPVLESEFRDMQDFEFTVEDGALHFLQSRSGKRTPWAALRIAADLVRAGVISTDEALSRLQSYDLSSIHRTRLCLDSHHEPVAAAIPAGMGVASGAIAFDADRAAGMASTGPVILVRRDLTTDDVTGLAASAGVLTANGGRTSHAAVVARHLGKVCLVGCSSLHVDESRRRCHFGELSFAEGDVITLDGESGSVYAGAVPTIIEQPDETLAEVRRWRTS